MFPQKNHFQKCFSEKKKFATHRETPLKLHLSDHLSTIYIIFYSYIIIAKLLLTGKENVNQIYIFYNHLSSITGFCLTKMSLKKPS